MDAEESSAGRNPPEGRGSPEPEPAVQHNQVNQIFYGAFDGSKAHFGIGLASPSTGGRATGWLDGGEIDALLGPYIEPDCFEAAVTALTMDSVVVVMGPLGCGKRSGAVALLRQVAEGADYVVLSPDLSLEQLAERTFEAGLGYVLLDRVNDSSGAGTDDFDWRRVRDRVRSYGAHLVVTTVHGADGLSPESVRHVPWHAPALADALRVRLRHAGCAEGSVEKAVELMPTGLRIAEVAAAAGQIAQGGDPDEVWQQHGVNAALPVRSWFAGPRSLQEIAEVTTLAFATGTGRRPFESLQELLEPCLGSAFAAAVPKVRTAPEPVGDEASVPETPEDAGGDGASSRPALDRRRSLTMNELASTEDQLHGAVTRTVMVFSSPPYRQWVLEELWANYSTSYWDGVRVWLNEIVLVDPDLDLQMSIASGLALLARPAFDEVSDCYLHPWARGEAGPTGRSMATLVLWWMCLDDKLGALALAVARSWAQSRDPQLRAAAGDAFSGQLGVRFPTDAVKWLWHLIAQGGAGSSEAMVSMASLLATLTERQEDAGVVLDTLAYRLGKQRAAVVATRLKTMTFGTVLAVLSARDLRTGQPVCAVLAVRQPQLRGKIGELWAAVLCNRPMRGAALKVLRRCLRSLLAVCADPNAVAKELGRAVGAEMAVDESELLATALRMRGAGEGARVAEVINSFIAGLLENEGLTHG